MQWTSLSPQASSSSWRAAGIRPPPTGPERCQPFRSTSVSSTRGFEDAARWRDQSRCSVGGCWRRRTSSPVPKVVSPVRPFVEPRFATSSTGRFSSSSRRRRFSASSSASGLSPIPANARRFRSSFPSPSGLRRPLRPSASGRAPGRPSPRKAQSGRLRTEASRANSAPSEPRANDSPTFSVERDCRKREAYGSVLLDDRHAQIDLAYSARLPHQLVSEDTR
jgi:hypothetical protein